MTAGRPRPVCEVCELHAEAVFKVEGMDCSEEVAILERRLTPLAGVETVAADIMGQRLRVTYDAARLTTAAMVDAVGQTGMRMWLEHEAPIATDHDVSTRFRLTVAAGATIAVAAAGEAAGIEWASWLFLPATALGGVHPLRRAWTAMRHRSIDINVLMLVAVAGAVGLGEWFEAASVVFLFALAQWLEARTLARARQAIQALVGLSPRDALVRRAGIEARLPIESVQVGDVVLVRPGEKIPVDGRVTAGEGEVNEAPITGESLPARKTPGANLYAGTINGRAALEFEVTRIGPDTRLARVIHLVEVAQAQRAPVQSFVDRFARVYTPVVIVLAALVALAPPLVAGGSAAEWLYRALVLLVIACPCALVISTPVSIVAALSAAARQGVLVKGGAHLERLAGVRVVAFDKTGTLTTGLLRVRAVDPVGPASPDDVLRYAAAVETRSEHPFARAVVAHARARGLDVPAASGFQAVPGRGASALVSSRRVVVGNEAFLAASGLPAAALTAKGGEPGDSNVWVGVDDVPLGVIRLADEPRATARETVDLLKAQRVEQVVILTGDQEGPTRAVAAAVGVGDWRSALLPEQKHDAVRALRQGGRTVMMVGDGINDAPALAAADVGVAMGAAGSDAAIETADVALMSDELLKLPYALRLARATLRNIRTNVGVSLVLKAAFLVLAISGSATLWMAVLADTGASIIVVANALRLLRAR